MEGPNNSERTDADKARAHQLQQQATEVMQRYRNGEADYSEVLPYINEIQRIQYNILQRKYPERFKADYDSVARIRLSPDSELHSQLLKNHPVTETIEQTEFDFWHNAITLNYPEIQLPESGTASDLFKSALRQLIAEYGERIDAKTITEIELYFIMKQRLEPEDFYKAQVLIENGLQ